MFQFFTISHPSFKAWKIAKTGFASLSLVDGGYFGKGIYFTTSVPYGYKYASYNNAGSKALILSWLIVGNVYPAIEFPHNLLSPDEYQNNVEILPEQKPSLYGGAIKGDSHFTIVRPFRNSPINYVPCHPKEMEQYATKGELFHEIVINQEPSVVPTYLIVIENI